MEKNNKNKNKKSRLEFIKTFPIETIPLTFLSIWRNKRRSFAILAGILLATTLLSGIILYNNTLKQNNYLSLVANQPYEVHFEVMGNATDESLENISKTIELDRRVIESTIIGTSSSNYRQSNFIQTDIFVSEELKKENPTGFHPNPIFVEENFLTSTIGQKLLDKDFEGSNSLGGDSAVISIQLALDLGLEIGDVIPVINFTQSIQKENGFTIVNGKLENITIVGTYKAETTTGFDFSSIFSTSLFTGDNIFLSHALLNEKTSMQALETSMRETGNFIVAVKIDVTQFSVDDIETFVQEVNLFMNQVTKDSSYDIQGTNDIQMPLMGYQIISIFITILYIVLSIPVIVLSIYLLNFGLEMSLEERRRDIAIKKMQGADSTQIFRELRNETMLMLIIGSILGYLCGIISAWMISSATGYMKLRIGTSADFLDFFYFDSAAFFWPLILTSLLLIFRIYRKGRAFIASEVTEGVTRREIIKESFFKKNYIDVIFFFVGMIGIGVILIDEFNIPINISSLTEGIIFFITPFAFWIGGSSVGSRLTKIIPLKLENSFLKLSMFKDVKNVIKSGLKRRGDMDRLSLIIILTLSIATVATIQGTTEEFQAERNIAWQIGADWQVIYNKAGDYNQNLTQIPGFVDSIGLYTESVKIYSSGLEVVAIDNSKELANLKNGNPVIHWQKDNFDRYTPQQGLQILEDNPRALFVSSDHLMILDANIGDVVDLKIPIKSSSMGETAKIEDVKILGVINQLPGGISFTMLTSLQLMKEIKALSLGLNADALNGINLNTSKYFVRTEQGDQITTDQIKSIQYTLDGISQITSHRSFYYEKAKIDTAAQGYGISGLLSLDFAISLIAALVSAFSFSAILMEKRKHEFAIIRAIGAKKKHIYKLALGENGLMMLTASLWGIFLGTGMAYLFNGVFIFVSMMSGGAGSFERMVMIPGLELFVICAFTLIGMLGAAIMSIRSSANQELALGVKEV